MADTRTGITEGGRVRHILEGRSNTGLCGAWAYLGQGQYEPLHRPMRLCKACERLHS